MARKKITLELLLKSFSCFLFGFVVGYFVFSIIAKPNENTVHAENIKEVEEEIKSEIPKTYSDLEFSNLKSTQTLTHQSKPIFDHIYDYAKYYIYYPKTYQIINEQTNAKEEQTNTPEPAIDDSSE